MGRIIFFAATRDDVQSWALLIFGLAGLSIPVIKKFGENLIALRKASREALRKDCIEELKRERQLTRELRTIIRNIENDRDEWKKRYDSGSRDHPQMGQDHGKA